jgi:rubrerythrin
MSTTLEKALKNSIEIERAAERYYCRLRDNAKDEEVKTFFAEMADQEAEHAAWIAKLGERLEAGELPQRADAKLGSVECAPGWEQADDISLAEAVEIALESENSAAMYYDTMSDLTTGEVKKFFQDLTRTEEQHAERLQQFRAERLVGGRE